MSGWDEKHGCEGPGVTGSAEHVGDPLTVEEIKALKPGARIVVTWSGGNGPHEGVVVEDEYDGLCYARSADSRPRHRLLNWPDYQTFPLNRVTLAPTPQQSGEGKA